MILDSICLHDFGVYSGRQEFDLSPPERNKPVVLIIGMNGAGKTTLINALQLCLWGSQARCFSIAGGSYQDFISKCINKSTQWNQASVEILFRRVENGEEAKYRVNRTWTRSARSIREVLEVSRNKQNDKSLTEDWPQLIEEILPVNIAHLFFFDGEQVASYASSDGARELVRSGIYGLLGLDNITQIQKDLSVLEKKKQKDMVKDKPANEEIEKKEQELKEIDESIKHLLEMRAIFQTREVDPLQRELENAKNEYSSQGGEIKERREAISSRANEAERILETINRNLVKSCDGLLPLLIIKPYLDELIKLSKVEESAAQARNVLVTVMNHDSEIINLVKKSTKSTKTIEEIAKYCESFQNELKSTANQKTSISLSEEIKVELKSILSGRLESAEQQAINNMDAMNKCQDELDAAKFDLEKIPPPEALADIEKNIAILKHSLQEKKEALSDMNVKIESWRRQKERIESNKDSLLNELTEAEFEKNKTVLFIERSQDARKALSKFQDMVLTLHSERIEALALQSYQALLRKETFISELRIDKKSFDISLYDKSHILIPNDNLSAGERQLLAISLLWGMAKASGRVIPVAIDTPMGRLDSEHRKHLVERYFPYVSHQIILLSTDEEIVGDYKKALQPFIGRSYTLEYDDSTDTTAIINDEAFA